MAQTYGFDGTVDEPAMAKMIDYAGADYAVQSEADWKVTAVAGADRTVKIAAGTGYGHFVLDEDQPEQTLQLDALGTGKRWDLICRRRNWQPPGGTSAFTKVTGTSATNPAAAIPSGRLRGPGVQDDQPLALVQITAGQTLPSQIIDLRYWATMEYAVGTLLALPDAKLGTIANLGGVRYRRELDAALNPTWTKQGVLKAVTSNVLTPQTGWSVSLAAGGSFPCRYLVDPTGTEVQYDVMLKRTGAAVQFGSDGGLADQTVAVLNGPRPDGVLPVPVQFSCVGGPTSTSNIGLYCFGYLSANGNLVLEAGIPNSWVQQWKTSSPRETTLQATIKFTKAA